LLPRNRSIRSAILSGETIDFSLSLITQSGKDAGEMISQRPHWQAKAHRLFSSWRLCVERPFSSVKSEKSVVQFAWLRVGALCSLRQIGVEGEILAGTESQLGGSLALPAAVADRRYLPEVTH
jgi:hypothetical protein